MSDEQLAWSGTVANCRMNRERRLVGRNSYESDLRFDVPVFLKHRLESGVTVRWLDLCCGRGLALLEAAQTFAEPLAAGKLELIGVDLVDQFEPHAPIVGLKLFAANLATWTPETTFDLITCVHGLHYLGDKPGMIRQACQWLTPRGLFLAHLDLNNLRTVDQRVFTRTVRRWFRESRLEFHPGFRILKCHGSRDITWKCRYLGADDQAGPNFTGQPAVNSLYEVTR